MYNCFLIQLISEALSTNKILFNTVPAALFNSCGDCEYSMKFATSVETFLHQPLKQYFAMYTKLKYLEIFLCRNLHFSFLCFFQFVFCPTPLSCQLKSLFHQSITFLDPSLYDLICFHLFLLFFLPKLFSLFVLYPHLLKFELQFISLLLSFL